MAPSENRNTLLPALKKKLWFLKFMATLRSLFVFCYSAPFICCSVLAVSYTYMEKAPVAGLMDYLTNSWKKEDLRKAAILINLQDFLSSYFEVVVEQMSDTFTGSFTMIIICTAVSTMSLMLLWISSLSDSEFAMVYVAIFLLPLGKAGQALLPYFLRDQLGKKVETQMERKREHGNTDDKKERDHINTITDIWWLLAKFLGIVLVFSLIQSQSGAFKFAALLMGGAALLFSFGCASNSRKSYEDMPTESDLGKIRRICRAALKKRKFRYPTSSNLYYWMHYKQNHLYNRGQELRLLPRVPRMFGWLDKAAIVKEQFADSDTNLQGEEMGHLCTVKEASEVKSLVPAAAIVVEGQFTDSDPKPQGEEKKGNVCTVKEVREVKSLVPLMFLGFTSLFGYSLVEASANTFFVNQVSYLKPGIFKNRKDNGDDISFLFVSMSIMNQMSLFICWLINLAFGKLRKKSQVTRSKRIVAIIIRIGIGMVCAVICCILAWRVETRRLYLMKKEKIPDHEHPDRELPMTTKALVPQFLLVGMAKGLIEGGFTNLFLVVASKSMWTFENSFSQMVIGTGKLFCIPLFLIFSSWVNKTSETSHFDRYYLMLAILNFLFLPAFGYVSFSIRYAYEGEFPNDEEIEEQRLDDAYEEDLGNKCDIIIKDGNSGSFNSGQRGSFRRTRSRDSK